MRFLISVLVVSLRFQALKPKVSPVETKGFFGRNLLRALFPELVALLLAIVDDGYVIIETDGPV